jgi:activator of HSP90 ATPase
MRLKMSEDLKLSVTLPVKPEVIYKAWLSSKKHSAMTSSEAKIDPKIGGKFTAWDGYIEGSTIELEVGKRILQKWRTTDFPASSQDSEVEIILKETEKGTKLTLIHTLIPKGQSAELKNGWKEFYFNPMKDYFKAQ